LHNVLQIDYILFFGLILFNSIFVSPILFLLRAPYLINAPFSNCKFERPEKIIQKIKTVPKKVQRFLKKSFRDGDFIINITVDYIQV